MRYKLPWQQLEPVQIEAAARAAAASIPGAEIEALASAELVTCYFTMGIAEARELDRTWGGGFDERLARAAEQPPDKVAIQVDFWHRQADPDWGLEEYCEFEFDTGRSGNWLCCNAALEITERLARHFGVEGQPSWE
jgi:hypothetical protein